jgi:hypothetical protein
MSANRPSANERPADALVLIEGLGLQQIRRQLA